MQQKPATIDTYTSVAGPGQAELIVKRSRFVALVYPVPTRGEAEALLAQAREAHPGARHICYAYKAGLSEETVRSSDAGEPSGTAGRPILDVVEREGLRNTLVAVVRYFGGVLLGAGGLVRAYSAAAAAGVAAAGKAAYSRHLVVQIEVDYQQYGRVERLLGEAGALLETPHYAERVTMRAALQAARADEITRQLADATGGRARCRSLAEEYRPLPAVR